MPKLAYALDALEPRMSAETLEYHYGKHLQAYIAKLNELILGTPYAEMSLEEIVRKSDGALYNNAAQAWNHTFFFETLTPTPTEMSPRLCGRLEADFGSVATFREQLTTAATGLFGSGWVWLTMDANGKLALEALANAGNPLRDGLRPLLTVDVWEHAYYIDYRNRRADYVNAVWELTDWAHVEERMEADLFNQYY